MASVNKVFLIGNLGKDPDVKFTPSGVQIAKFSMATSERFKRGDNWEEKTDWHNIVLFGRQAEYAGEYLKKGMTVFLEGKISTRTWDDENGVRKYITEIIGFIVITSFLFRHPPGASSGSLNNQQISRID